MSSLKKKQLTKAEREKAQIDALKQRIRDWVYGSSGRVEDEEPLSAKTITDVMRAIHVAFNLEHDNPMFKYWNIESFDTIDSTAKFLFDKGFMANGLIVERAVR